MRYVVLDLEWNIPWKRDDLPLDAEVIEIGAWLLDKELNFLSSFNRYVRGELIDNMHPYVAKLTSRDDESLAEGISFKEAVADILDWVDYENKDDKLLFCTWSNNDIKPWKTNLNYYNLTWPESIRFFDIQRLYDRSNKKIKSQKSSVDSAAHDLDIPIEKPLHKAINDAFYTAKIFQKTVKHLQEVEKFPKDPQVLFNFLYKQAVDITLNRKLKLDLGKIQSLKEMQPIAKRYDFTCPTCHRDLIIPEEFKSSRNNRRLKTMAYCPVHGQVKVKLTAKRNRYKRDKTNSYKVNAELKLGK